MDRIETTSFRDFRANLEGHFDDLRRAKRPKIVTRKGRAAAVMLDPGDFEAYASAKQLIDDLRAIQRGRRDFAAGKGISVDDARKRLLARYERKARRARG